MRDFPKTGWVFVYFIDGIEYGLAERGELNIGGTTFNVRDAKCWTSAPEPSHYMI